MESRNKVIIAILVIAVIVAGVMATYYGIGARNTDAKIADLENKLDEANNNLATTKAELAKSYTKINDVKEALGVSEETTTTNTTKTNEYKTPYVDFSKGKCLNSKSQYYSFYPKKEVSFNNDIVVTLDSNSNKVSIDVKKEHVKAFYGVEFVEDKKYEVSNFSKKVSNIYICGWGHSVGNESILYLMEDGTIQYTKIEKALKENSFESLISVNNVINIIDIVPGTISYVEPENGGTGWRTFYGITSNGDYYELGDMINK